MANKAAFSMGQIIQHKLFQYRGVIYDVDAVYQGTEEWYERVAKSRPPKDQPWYHVLVDGQGTETYVAERNLAPDSSQAPVDHPLLSQFFCGYHAGVYKLRRVSN